MVEPEAKMPGSTSVACWLSELVKVSVLNRVSANCCCGGGDGEGVLWPPPQASQSSARIASPRASLVLAVLFNASI